MDQGVKLPVKLKYFSEQDYIAALDEDKSGLPLVDEGQRLFFLDEEGSDISHDDALTFKFSIDKVYGKSNKDGKTPLRFILAADENVLDDGYKIKATSSSVTVSARCSDGLVNGLYSLLEHVGIMFTHTDHTYYPSRKNLFLPIGEKCFNPAFPWRNVYSKETWHNDWARRLRLNGVIDIADRSLRPEGWTPYKENEDTPPRLWGTWCHSMFDLLPPSEFFSSHPEYYTLIGGKRRVKTTNFGTTLETAICPSSEGAYQETKKRLLDLIEKNPSAKYWDVSIMDNWFIKGCECPQCKKLAREESSPIAPYLKFLNRLADEIHAVHPDVCLSTLAYLYTYKPPKHMKASDNLLIKLCSMPGSNRSPYSHPETKGSRQFAAFMKQWRDCAKNIVIWDYVVDFKHLMMPFPNFSVLSPNLKFFKENGARGVFSQASREWGSENAEMRAYLLSHLMFDADTDVEKLLSRYIAVTYGNAAETVTDYFNALLAHLYEGKEELGMFMPPSAHSRSYLKPSYVTAHIRDLEKALSETEEDSVADKHLKRLLVGLYYVVVNNRGYDKDYKRDRARLLIEYAESTRVERFAETKHYLKDYKALLEKKFKL